ncbi:MAG: YbjN domain-containing protein [Proteobacteria bacterium]|nr:YbjN domain-containing protein [Pseudomonadota bacterium]
MSQYFENVIEFTSQLSLEIIQQDNEEELIIVNNEDRGIYQLVIDCEYPILILEQLIYTVKNPTIEHLKRLLQMNRNLIHGAFTLDATGNQMIFRDTLQLENLDFNEFEGTINALSLGLAEFSRELLALNK